MITGDYLKTAIAIAKNVQILQPQDDEALLQPRFRFSGRNVGLFEWCSIYNDNDLEIVLVYIYIYIYIYIQYIYIYICICL